MKIQKDFCDLTRFLQVNAGLTCRQKCHSCQKKWKDTGTQAISRGVMLEKVNGRLVEKVVYLCANCADEITATGTANVSNVCE